MVQQCIQIRKMNFISKYIIILKLTVLIVPYTNGRILNPGFDKTMTCILMGIHIFQSLSQASFLTLSSLQMNFLKYHLYFGFCCLVRIQRLQTIRYVLVLPHLKLLLPKQNEQPQVHLKIKSYLQILSKVPICFLIIFVFNAH